MDVYQTSTTAIAYVPFVAAVWLPATVAARWHPLTQTARAKWIYRAAALVIAVLATVTIFAGVGGIWALATLASVLWFVKWARYGRRQRKVRELQAQGYVKVEKVKVK